MFEDAGRGGLTSGRFNSGISPAIGVKFFSPLGIGCILIEEGGSFYMETAMA